MARRRTDGSEFRRLFCWSWGNRKKYHKGLTKTPSGNYDALGVLRNLRLAYFECKSGSFDETDVLKCYERMQSLNCDFSILIGQQSFEDDKLKWISQKLRLPLLHNHTMDRINIAGNITDLIYDFNNCYLIDMSGDLINKSGPYCGSAMPRKWLALNYIYQRRGF